MLFLLLAKYEYFGSRYLSGLSNINSVRTAVSLVKTKGSVLATTHLAPHLSHRLIKVLNKKSDLELINNSFDYIIFDLQHPGRGISSELILRKVEKLKQEPDLKLSYQQDEVFLFEKVLIK